MKKHLLASAAIVALAALAVPAAAEITVDAFVDYDKDVNITETLTKAKAVALVVTITTTGTTAAEANAVTNQRIGAVPTEFQGPPPNPTAPAGNGPNSSTYTSDPTIFRATADFLANTAGSVNTNTGVTQYNQDVGTGNNQANVLSAAVGTNAFFAEANNAAAQYITNERVIETGHVNENRAAAVLNVRYSNLDGSVNGNTGVVQVNQSSGVFNNQLNAAAIALGVTPGSVALAESDLGQWNTGNATSESFVARTANINNSGNSNTGVVMGNQSAGYMANQANMLSVSASVTSAPAGAALNGFLGNITPNF